MLLKHYYEGRAFFAPARADRAKELFRKANSAILYDRDYGPLHIVLSRKIFFGNAILPMLIDRERRWSGPAPARARTTN